MMYSLASELGREDNDLLWLTIVGVTSQELYGRSSVGVAVTTQKPTASGWLGTRGSRTRQVLRDERDHTYYCTKPNRYKYSTISRTEVPPYKTLESVRQHVTFPLYLCKVTYLVGQW
ncbi:cell division control 45 protein [Rutstroemia sp. NJR-2017a BBW]|nr:cell division control 45 protein [Rutstroemia sp. NJR-2017a BBW]